MSTVLLNEYMDMDMDMDIIVILETILQVIWSNQQCHSTEGQRLINHVNGQSHQAQLLKGKERCNQKNYYVWYWEHATGSSLLCPMPLSFIITTNVVYMQGSA